MEKMEKIWNRRFILLFLTNLLVLAAFYASIPIIPVYCEEIGITGSKVGIVLTAMSVATVLFRPVAGYLLDNFNRYHVYLLFLAMFCLSFPAFLLFPTFGLLILVRLYMGAVYSVCASAIMSYLPYFYICLVVGMLLSKTSTQKVIDAGDHGPLVCASLAVLIVTMISFLFLTSGIHLLAAGFFFGLGYGILQPLFQSFVTGTTPAPQRGVANSTYMLSYDIGIGIGSLLMGFMQESIGLTTGFAVTAIAYVAGGIVYLTYVEGYYRRLRKRLAVR